MFDFAKAGERIAALRKAKGYTQEVLAESLGVSPQAVSKWENGHTMPEASLLPALSDILGSTVDQILKPDVSEKRTAIINYLTRIKEILVDAADDIKKAITLH